MAKDRAKDPKRVFQTPASHVNVISQDWTEGSKNKFDSDFHTDAERTRLDKIDQNRIARENAKTRISGKTPVVKIKS